MRYERLTEKAKESISSAQELAQEYGQQQVGELHLLAALLAAEAGTVPRLLARAAIDLPRLNEACLAGIAKLPKVSGGQMYLSSTANEVLEKAFAEADALHDEFVTSEALLLGLLEGRHEAAALLSRFGVTRERVLQTLKEVRGSERASDPQAEERYEALERYTRDLTAEAKKGKLDPVIGRDTEIRRAVQVLSRRTKNNPVLIGEPGVGKTAIVEGLAQRIVRGDVPENLKNRRLLVLDLGALLAGAKFRGEFEDRLKSVLKAVSAASGEVLLFIDELHTLVGAGAAEGAMDAGNMLKPALARGELHCIGATTLNEYRKYIEKDAALERRFQPILVGEPDVADTISILRGLKERYELHHGVRIKDAALIAAATLADRYIKDRFLPDKAVDLVDEAASRLRIEIDSLPTEIDELRRRILQLQIEREALRKETDAASVKRLSEVDRQIAELKEKNDGTSAQWQREKEIIGKIRTAKSELEKARFEEERATRAGDFESAARSRHGEQPRLARELESLNAALGELQKHGALLKEEVDEEDVAQVVSAWSGVPVGRLLEGETAKLLHMEERIGRRLVGQERAVKAVADAVRRARAGLNEPNRPVGSFIFLGPTGVGKTELARALAEFLFDDERNMIRLDMSEYMEKHSVARLIGAPPGYVGYEEGGSLTEALRRMPYSVILFDEIEKAHRDVFNILLQILEDGRLTDGQGRTVNASNALIIMTSNIGSTVIQEAEDADDPAVEAQVMAALRAEFRPEFLNRVDDIILFSRLSRAQLRQIVEIRLAALNAWLKRRELTLFASEAAKDALVDLGYEPTYGARPLKRVIQRELQDKLARELLAGRFLPGQGIEVSYDAGGFHFAPRAL